MKRLVFTFIFILSMPAVYASGPIGNSIPKVSAVDSVNLADYVGKYKMEGLPFEEIAISLENGKLTLLAGDQVGELTPLSETDKFDANGQATFKFSRGEDKKVTGVTLDAQGMQFEGKRQP